MVLLTILFIILMIAISGLLAATETAVTAASPGRLYKLKASDVKKTVIALKILKLKEKVISTMLIGNSLINTICTTIATGLFIRILEDPQLGTLVASGVMAFVIIVFAEVIPKAVAVTKAEKIIIWNAYFVWLFLKALNPVNIFLDFIIRIFCRIFGISLQKEFSGIDEVRGVIEHHHYEGNVYKSDRDMLEGILDMRDMTIYEIMVHRSKVNSINIDLPKAEIVRAILNSPNSRLPVWKDNEDNIIGVLHIKDVLKSLYENNNASEELDILKLLTPAWFIPENTLVMQQLQAFRERKQHLACVVDEYGSMCGIATLEDILEEIVGQIQDEHDKNNDLIIRKSDNEFIVPGDMTIRDLNRELNWDLSDEEASTIAGLMINKLERIPNPGECIEILNFKLIVHKKNGNKITMVKIDLMPIENLLQE